MPQRLCFTWDFLYLAWRRMGVRASLRRMRSSWEGLPEIGVKFYAASIKRSAIY